MREVACSVRHFGAVSPALSRIRVAKLEAVGIDMAIACLGCAEKPCLECPSDSLEVGDDGVIRVDDDSCIECGECVDACPVGAVGYHEERPLFCDLCDGETECVQICPTDALYLEDKEGPSLEAFAGGDASASQRRVAYAKACGEPMRERWAAGGRLGP
jgi:Fe-S-cluster-containing hydrogenase component 2